jgi:exodeoxyribonuclease-5
MVEFTPEQEIAAARIRAFLDADKVDKPYLTMHGWAGTGKTTVLGAIAREYPGTLLCTLTGRAAEVLRRKTGASAFTIHSAFYKLREEVKSSDGRDRLKWDTVHDDDSMAGSALLLDECSMIDTTIANDLMRTGVRIVACGDPGQLPPVNGEQFFTTPDIMLKTVHRQALDSPVLRQAHWVRLGRGYHSDGDDFRVVDRLDPGEAIAADMVLCWRNVTRKTVNHLLRRMKGVTAVNPQPGEPVLCLKNSADYGLFNGAIYELAEEFRDGDNTIKVIVDGSKERISNVRFEGFQDTIPRHQDVTTSFAFGYVLTVHKSQGSEFDNVVFIDEYSRQDGRTQFVYTAITRAAKRMTVVRRR